MDKSAKTERENQRYRHFQGLDVRSVVAKMESGVLTLTIPRAAASDLKSLKAGTT